MSQSQTIFHLSVPRKLVTTAFVTVELFSEKGIRVVLNQKEQEILVLMVSKLQEITGLSTILTILITKPAHHLYSNLLILYNIKIKDAIVMNLMKKFLKL